MGNKYNYQTFENWCINNNRQDILDLWDYDKNDVTPADVPAGTKQKYYFKCLNGIHDSELRRLLNIIDKPDHKLICKQCAYNAVEDLTGNVYGELTVIGYDEENSKDRKQDYYFCECSCGNKISVSKYKLKNMKKTICGRKGRHFLRRVDVINPISDDVDIFSSEYLDSLRHSTEYYHYRQEVLKKDNYRCIVCGTNRNLEVHHIYQFAKYSDERLNPKTGICMCKEHHSVSCPSSFHTLYGKYDNTPEQLEKYVNDMRKKIGNNEHFDVYEYMEDYDSDNMDIDDSMLLDIYEE